MRRLMIWFDFGGVLSPPLVELFDAYQVKTGVGKAQMEAAMRLVAKDLGISPLAALELARISEVEWGKRMALALTTLYPDIDLSRCRLQQFGQQWFDGVEPNHAMVQATHMVRETNCRLGILTNNVIEWEPYWTELIRPVGDVDCIIDSCKYGVRKPEQQIFRIACETAAAAPADCVLIDDSAENCAAACAMAWRAIHFQSNRPTLSMLRDLLP